MNGVFGQIIKHFFIKNFKTNEKKIIKSSYKIVSCIYINEEIFTNKFKYDLKNISVNPTCADENQFNIQLLA